MLLLLLDVADVVDVFHGWDDDVRDDVMISDSPQELLLLLVMPEVDVISAVTLVRLE